ncbi:MAG: hypothetical protein ACTHJR_20645 [Sphingomonas sp.]|uniref:hypothetical protein n=1 Tax=Sphingomonas sp. TaxID=28214 RepID=UPI003F8129A2
MSDWDDPSVPLEPRKIRHDALLVVALLIFIGTQFVSDRPIGFVNRPIVVDVAPLPPKADRDRYATYISAGSYMIPKLKRPNALNAARAVSRLLSGGVEPSYARPAVRLGYSAREIDAFGMPFFAYKEAGYVLYFDDWESDDPYMMASPVGDEGLGVLRKELGVDIGRGWIFPFWAYFWGWVPLLLGGAWGWLQYRRRERRRAALGII